MGRLTGSSLLLLLTLLVALPSDALHAQKDKDKKKMDAPDVKAVDSAKLSGEFVGSLKSTPGSDRNFIVTVETPRLVPTGNAPRINGNNNVTRIIQLQNNIVRDQQQ